MIASKLFLVIDNFMKIFVQWYYIEETFKEVLLQIKRNSEIDHGILNLNEVDLGVDLNSSGS